MASARDASMIMQERLILLSIKIICICGLHNSSHIQELHVAVSARSSTIGRHAAIDPRRGDDRRPISRRVMEGDNMGGRPIGEQAMTAAERQNVLKHEDEVAKLMRSVPGFVGAGPRTRKM
jgi:hypothetical protein